MVYLQLKLKLKLVGQFVFVFGTHLVPISRFLLLGDICGFYCGVPSPTSGRACDLLAQLLLELVSAINFRSKSGKPLDLLLSHLRLPKPGGPDPRIYISQEQVGPVIAPGTGFFAAFYDLQDYGGGILTRLHTGNFPAFELRSKYSIYSYI
jgi:hypothetical protein